MATANTKQSADTRSYFTLPDGTKFYNYPEHVCQPVESGTNEKAKVVVLIVLLAILAYLVA